MIRPRTFAPFAIAVALLLPVVARAEHKSGPVNRVGIAVIDPVSGTELTVLSPGQEFWLAPGEEVIVRLVEPHSGARSARRSLPVEGIGFGGQQTPLEILRLDRERGEALVRLNAATPGERWHIGYKLDDSLKLTGQSEQLGRVLVRVAGNGGRSITGKSSLPSTYEPGYAQPADRVVSALYRGILLRNIEPGAPTGFRDDIARNGFDGVLRVARDIANSEESRYRVYQDRGVSNEQRLDSLYRELLGWSRSQVNRDQWLSDLAQLERGNLAGVVESMVRSEAFRSRFGF